ncbi:MAG: hypothetical protein ACK5AC_17900 [Planctomycetota bacterium]
MRSVWLSLASVAIVALPGCQCMQQMERWKCDNWGMCHFAQPRPGVYSPMVLPPSYGVPPTSYGVPPTGLAAVPTANPVYPASSMASTAAPPVTYAAPPSAPTYAPSGPSPYGGAVVPSGNCRECQK